MQRPVAGYDRERQIEDGLVRVRSIALFRRASRDRRILPGHHDGGCRHPLLLHKRIEGRGIVGMQPDAAVGGRAAKLVDLITAMDRKAAMEEDRMRHRRIVVFAREPVGAR